MKKNYYAVIMAGGIGSRFWPLSTQDNPKQFHDMLGTGQSLLQHTYYRFKKCILDSNILISTNDRYRDKIFSQLPSLRASNLVLEPCIRNTAPCILYSALKIHQENPNATMVITPSDHWVENESKFLNDIEYCLKKASCDDILVTLGVKPLFANTGYGYIKYGKQDTRRIKKVEHFTEKPSLQVASEFINKGNYLWNSGIFVWKTNSILNAFKKHLPQIYNLFINGYNIYNKIEESKFIQENYAKSENISIDFGIIEKADNVYVLPTDFGWSDLGTWKSLYEKLAKDKQKNVQIGGEVLFKNSKQNIVKSEKNKHIFIQDLNNYIVVEKDDIIIICPKDKEQEIKQISQHYKRYKLS